MSLFSTPASEMTTVVWFKDGKPLKANDRVKVSSSGDDHFLQIPKVLARDAAEYTVIATNLAGDTFFSVQVSVEGKVISGIEKGQDTTAVKSNLEPCGMKELV